MSFPPPSAAPPTGEGGGGQGPDRISPGHGIISAAQSAVGLVPAPPTDEPREQATRRPPCSTSSDSRQAEGPSSVPSASGEGNDVAVDIQFDPISLKEPKDLHSWNWLSSPCGWSFPVFLFLHKRVKEVDGRDQLCALLVYASIIMAFIGFATYTFMEAYFLRASPPQVVQYMSGQGIDLLDRFPNVVMCFNIPDTAVAQYSVGWEGLGWRFRLPNSTVVPIEDDSTTLELRRSIKWFKGPACPTTAFIQLSKCFYYNASALVPDKTWFVEMRSLGLGAAFVRGQGNEVNDALVRDAGRVAWMTVTLEPQEAFCHTQAPVNWLLVPTEPLRVGGKQMVYPARMELQRYVKLSEYKGPFSSNQLPAQYTYKLEQQAAYSRGDGDGMVSNDRYQVLVLLTQSSMMYLYEEREPFQLFALIGTIGGAWTIFIAIFIQLFPAGNGGKRRARRVLQPCTARIMPPKVKEDMESFDRVLGGGGSSGDMTSDGEAKAPDEGREEGADQEEVKQASGEEKEDKADGKAASASERRLFWLNMFNRRSASDTSAGRLSSSSSSLTTQRPAHRVELPSLEDRMLEVEAILKRLVEREARSGGSRGATATHPPQAHEDDK